MRVIQLLPVLHFGDAVGNEAIALLKILRKAGYETDIYAGDIDKRISKEIAKPLSELELRGKDIAILHLAIGTQLNYDFANYPCRKIVFYHNITPPRFFRAKDNATAKFCERGLASVKYLADKVDYCIADSEFNKQDLRKAGYQCPIDVLPILIPIEDYNAIPNQAVIKKYSDEGTNIVFIGRVVQNKKQEDIIEAFAYYKKYYDPRARLFIIGNCGEKENYYSLLKEYVSSIKVKDVIFTGKVSFPELISYYKIADVFLCMSEHEGFCVPLVESMHFQVPIIAYASCAIPETLGGGGILLHEKTPLVIAGMINRLRSDKNFQETVIKNQDERLKDFSHDIIATRFLSYLHQFTSRS